MLPKLLIIPRNDLNKSYSELNFLQKSHWMHLSIFPWNGVRGSKDCRVWNIMYWNGKVDLLQGWMLPKLPITSKNGWNKNCSELNSLHKTQWVHRSISPPWSGAKCSKDCLVCNIFIYRNRKVDLLYSRTLQKMPITSKNGSNENYSELYSVQKTWWRHTSIRSPPSEWSQGWYIFQSMEWLKVDWLNVW